MNHASAYLVALSGRVRDSPTIVTSKLATLVRADKNAGAHQDDTRCDDADPIHFPF